MRRLRSFSVSEAHLLEDGLVVVDVVDSHDDLGGAAERVRAAGRVVVRGGDVEDVLRPPEPGGRAPPQLDDAFKDRGFDTLTSCPSRRPAQQHADVFFETFLNWFLCSEALKSCFPLPEDAAQRGKQTGIFSQVSRTTR